MPVAGAGFLIANDILMDCSYCFFQPVVDTVVGSAGIPAGNQTVQISDSGALYVGAMIIVDGEVVTVSGVDTPSPPSPVPPPNFSATFQSPHGPGGLIRGATFPLFQYDQTTPMYTQAEMLAYLASAVNDFLTDVPLCYNVVETGVGSAGAVFLPSDFMLPVRIATNGYPIRESSQVNMDAYDYNWMTENDGSPTYYRDKLALQTVNIWSISEGSPVEIVYAQRQITEGISLLDGFIVPDPFMNYVLSKTLAYAYMKDGEARNPGLARWYQTRYDMGVKISRMFLDSIVDPNLEMQGQQ